MQNPFQFLIFSHIKSLICLIWYKVIPSISSTVMAQCWWDHPSQEESSISFSDISHHFSVFKDPSPRLLMLKSTTSRPHCGLLLTFLLKLLSWFYVIKITSSVRTASSFSISLMFPAKGSVKGHFTCWSSSLDRNGIKV